MIGRNNAILIPRKERVTPYPVCGAERMPIDETMLYGPVYADVLGGLSDYPTSFDY